jgi:hypothetical protein
MGSLGLTHLADHLRCGLAMTTVHAIDEEADFALRSGR